MKRSAPGTEFETAFRSMAEGSTDPASVSIVLSDFSEHLADTVRDGIRAGLNNVALAALLDRLANNLPTDNMPTEEAISQFNKALEC